MVRPAMVAAVTTRKFFMFPTPFALGGLACSGKLEIDILKIRFESPGG